MTSPAADGPVRVCFQFVTKGGAVIDSEPEEWPSVLAATKRAEEWMNLPAGKTIAFITYEGDGAVVRPDETEFIAVLPEKKMADLYETYKQAAAEQNQEKST